MPFLQQLRLRSKSSRGTRINQAYFTLYARFTVHIRDKNKEITVNIWIFFKSGRPENGRSLFSGAPNNFKCPLVLKLTPC